MVSSPISVFLYLLKKKKSSPHPLFASLLREHLTHECFFCASRSYGVSDSGQSYWSWKEQTDKLRADSGPSRQSTEPGDQRPSQLCLWLQEGAPHPRPRKGWAVANTEGQESPLWGDGEDGRQEGIPGSPSLSPRGRIDHGFRREGGWGSGLTAVTKSDSHHVSPQTSTGGPRWTGRGSCHRSSK